MTKKIAITAAALATALTLAVAAHAAPVRVPATVSNGIATITIAPVYNRAATGMRISSIWCDTAAGNTNTAKIVIGGVTNGLAPKAITATDHVMDVSASPLLVWGDRLIVTSSATNSHLIYLVGEEL